MAATLARTLSGPTARSPSDLWAANAPHRYPRTCGHATGGPVAPTAGCWTHPHWCEPWMDVRSRRPPAAGALRAHDERGALRSFCAAVSDIVALPTPIFGAAWRVWRGTRAREGCDFSDAARQGCRPVRRCRVVVPVRPSEGEACHRIARLLGRVARRRFRCRRRPQNASSL